MDPNAQPTTRTELLSTYWRDPEYLTHVPLTSHTALDYFSRSVFFDPTSTNEILRMQNIATTGGGITNKPPREQETELKRFKGIEFVLVHAETAGEEKALSQYTPQAGGRGFQYVAEDTLFLVQKRRRETPSETHVLETYYVLNGNVHMAPDLETVLQNRLINSLHSLRQSLSIARDNQYRPILPPSATPAAKASKQGPPSKTQSQTAASSIQSQQPTTLGAQAAAAESQQQAHTAADTLPSSTLPGDNDDDEDFEMEEV